MHNQRVKAIAKIRGDREHPQLRGMVTFIQTHCGVMIEAKICGLPKTETGFFAFHIHDGDNCSGKGFPNTGSHFNPKKTVHPNHSGDLPPLLGSSGKAYIKVFTDRFHLEELIGKNVVIHRDPDDYRTQPSGNAGEKIACGVIYRV